MEVGKTWSVVKNELLLTGSGGSISQMLDAPEGAAGIR
jgi:hypothetical protein